MSYMEIWEEKTEVNYYDVDINGRIRLSSLLKKIHIICDKHCVNNGIGYNELKNKGMAFYFSRLAVKFHKCPVYMQKILIKTWHEGVKGAAFIRNGEILDENNKQLAEWSIRCALVNIDEKRMCRPKEIGISLLGSGKLGVTVETEKIAIPDNLIKTGEFLVGYNAIDMNGHLNNVYYADIVTNSLNISLSDYNIDNFQINYLTEAMPYSIIDIYTKFEQGNHFVVGKIKDTEIFSSFITLKSLMI